LYFREADIQWVAANNLFHTPGFVYRPAGLKAMTALLGNTEERIVYDNFRLDNLNSNNFDYTHFCYEEYLKNHKFLMPFDKSYFNHTKHNVLPTPPGNRELSRGIFNVFPLDLSALNIKHPIGTTLGIFFNFKI